PRRALTKEVAATEVHIERRKELHERTGQALESMCAAQLDDHLAQLAHHYSHSENIDKAVEYLGRTGLQALQRSAYADAIGGLNAAIDLLQRLPDGPKRIDKELQLQLALGSASIPVAGWAALEVERAFTRARELCERLDDPAQLYPALSGRWTMDFSGPALRAAHD